MAAGEYTGIHQATRPARAQRVDQPLTDPYRRLAAAAIAQAVRDVDSTNPRKAADALTWLLGGAADWADALDVDPAAMRARVAVIALGGGEHDDSN